MSVVLVAALAAGLAAACAMPGPGGPGLRQASRAADAVWLVAVAGATAVAIVAVGADPEVIVRRAGSWLGPALLTAAATPAVVWLRVRARARRMRLARSAEVLEICEELAGDLAAGATATLALRRAADRWPELAGPAAAQRLGTSVPDAWRALATRPGAGDLSVVAAAWEVADRTGAGLADALTAVAAGIRDQQRTRRVVASELASARATARLMAALPLLTLAVGSGAGDPVGFLLGTPAGLLCAAAGVALALAGVGWIETIASSLERDAAGSVGP